MCNKITKFLVTFFLGSYTSIGFCRGISLSSCFQLFLRVSAILEKYVPCDKPESGKACSTFVPTNKKSYCRFNSSSFWISAKLQAGGCGIVFHRRFGFRPALIALSFSSFFRLLWLLWPFWPCWFGCFCSPVRARSASLNESTNREMEWNPFHVCDTPTKLNRE